MEPTFGTPTGGTPDDDLRQRAVERLDRKRAFFRSLTTFVILNVMFWVIWLISGFNGGTWFPWPIFPLLGWGIGIAFQARSVFARDDKHSEDEIQREIRKLGGE